MRFAPTLKDTSISPGMFAGTTHWFYSELSIYLLYHTIQPFSIRRKSGPRSHERAVGAEAHQPRGCICNVDLYVAEPSID